MYVPLEVVKKGKTEEYVRLIEKRDELNSKISGLKYEYRKIVTCIFNELVPNTYYNEEKYLKTYGAKRYFEEYYIGDHNVWKQSVMIEGLSKQLLEISGDIAKTRLEIEENDNKLEELKRG